MKGRSDFGFGFVFGAVLGMLLVALFFVMLGGANSIMGFILGAMVGLVGGFIWSEWLTRHL